MPQQHCRYDLDGLAKELELELGDLAVLFLNYLEEMKSEAAELQRYLNERDWNMLERTVHNIKGVSVNLGVMDVYQEAERFDRLLKEGKTEQADVGVTQLTELLRGAEVEIRDYFTHKGYSI